MKKAYLKPMIVFESFTLSTNIAGDCEIRTWTPSSGNCAYEITDEFGDTSFVFLDTIQACTTHQQDDGTSGFCYHVPYDNNTLFNS